jgi:hypothetical protein
MQEHYTYPGLELDMFAEASNWRRYWASQIIPYISGRVLEVGAGLGINTPVLSCEKVEQWLMLEPDGNMAAQLEAAVDEGALDKRCKVINGTLQSLASGLQFDTIIYIDVLEHIEDDRSEFNLASEFLVDGGHIIVLAPAHEWLFSEFDQAVGHYRRYNAKTLVNAAPETLVPLVSKYLDCIGIFCSIGNRMLLRSSIPQLSQIRFWDHILVRISRVLDPIFFYKLGKTLIVVFRKTSAE